MRHLNNGTDHRHSKSCCDQSSPARRTIKAQHSLLKKTHASDQLIRLTVCVSYNPSQFFIFFLRFQDSQISPRVVTASECIPECHLTCHDEVAVRWYVGWEIQAALCGSIWQKYNTVLYITDSFLPNTHTRNPLDQPTSWKASVVSFKAVLCSIIVHALSRPYHWCFCNMCTSILTSSSTLSLYIYTYMI